ncbi:hypothetical protein CYY_004852 [Polysphondylium violaceum]|uniref:Major facilitator superfamily (MFS) profile domain-containing protein n=1 Tax=Polysphondylium violaceum TaxID=133409 RepID=A0A8J4PUJ7_9MYCE|nr:hypothetical protein CYY_004852 [Polysphondylium violaceum]
MAGDGVAGVPSPLPWKRLIGAYVLLVCEAISTTSFFAYSGYMIVYFGLVEKLEDVGYFAGYVASFFSFAQFLSSFFWGKMSDKYGRKPILIVGSMGSMLSVLVVGTSVNLPMLIAARCINGLLNGNIGVIKTYIGECTDKSNQVEAFGWIGLTWGLGSIIGPMIGGALIEPVDNFPFLFKNSKLFKSFPYLLPNLVIALTTLIGFTFTYFYMKETLHKKEPSIQLDDIEDQLTTGMTPEYIHDTEDIHGNGIIMKDYDDSEISGTIIGGNSNDIDGQDNNISNTKEEEKKNLLSNIIVGDEQSSSEYKFQDTNYTLNDDEKEKLYDPHHQREELENRKEMDSNIIALSESTTNFQDIPLDSTSLARGSMIKKSFSTIFNLFNSGKKEQYFQLSKDNSNSSPNLVGDGHGGIIVEKEQHKEVSVFKDKLILKTTILYAIVGFIFTMYDEGFPIWAMAPVSAGGLSFTARQIGATGAIGGVTVVIIQVLLIKPMTKKYGILKTFFIGGILSIISFFSFPIITYVSPYGGDSAHQPSPAKQAFFWFFMCIILTLRNIAGQFIFTPVMTLINNSARMKVRASANGLGQSLVALSRAVAPFVSNILAWSLTSGYPFPLNHFLMWIIMVALCLIPTIMSKFFLPITLNAPIVENDDDEIESEEESANTHFMIE